MTAEDIVVLLTYLQRRHRAASSIAQSNRGPQPAPLACFQTAWLGRLRITTTSSAAGATARIAVIVQTGCGFLVEGEEVPLLTTERIAMGGRQ